MFIILFIKHSNCSLIVLNIYIHMFLKVSYIFIAMASFTNMRFCFGGLDIFSDGEHRIVVRLCKKIVVLMMCKCFNNLECSCKCCLKE